MNNQFDLLKERRFWPLFVTQFLGAFNDNLFKQVLSVMVAYGVIETGGARPEILVSLAAALFIVPFVLFTPFAGGLADKFDKAHIARVLKITEIIIVLAAIAGFLLQSVWLLMAVLFALGAQSAFFSPSKFSILPQHLKQDELIGGNALVNTGTYLAILLGTILGGLLALNAAGVWAAAFLLLVCALAGYWSSRRIPPAPPSVPGLRLSYNAPREAWRSLAYARAQSREVFASIMGSAWFFFTGAMLLAQFPNFTRQVLGVDNVVLTFFMVTFSVGVALGGLLNNRLLRSKIAATYVPAAALVIALFAVDLYFASRVYNGVPLILNSGELLGIGAFLSYPSGWHVVLDLFAISLAGGIYVVPLKSIIQDRTPRDHSARVLAASSLMDAVFVLLSAVVAIAAFTLGFKVHHLFIIVAAGSVAVAVYIMRSMGEDALRQIWRKIHG